MVSRPANTPPAIVNKLNAEIERLSQLKEVREQMANVAFDPYRQSVAAFTEIIRNGLVAITEEMRIALQSVSGSPTVTEASDFFTGLFLPDGSVASMGFQVAFAVAGSAYLLAAIAWVGIPNTQGKALE